MSSSVKRLQNYCIERITDISYSACENVGKMQDPDLVTLYNYHKNLSVGPNALYPQTNWQAHRLMLMSCVAAELGDSTRMLECDKLIKDWLKLSDCKCCDAKSQDYHWRDSVTYVVYGIQAIVNACLYLQEKNPTWKYALILKPYIDFINKYETKRVVHVEFLKSNNMPEDTKKRLFKKTYPTGYAKTLLRIYKFLL